MAEKSKPGADPQEHEQALQALRTFESILEIMPDDHGTLEAVIIAANQCGEYEKARNCRIHLAELLLAEGDVDSAESHIQILRTDEDPQARSWIAAYDLKTSAASSLELGEADEEDHARAYAVAETGQLEMNISDEIDLAWKILEQGHLTQEEYNSLVKDLTEMSATKRMETVSVLHALEGSHHKNLESILDWMSQTSHTPCISLACFAMRAELLPLLPEEFIVYRGALPFEIMGRELLVGVLNPFNQKLRTEVANITGRPCHFYLVRASEFEEARKRLRATVEGT